MEIFNHFKNDNIIASTLSQYIMKIIMEGESIWNTTLIAKTM